MESLRLRLDNPEMDNVLSRAYMRVEQYLCSLRIHNKRILNELTHAIVEDIRQKLLAGDTREPVEIAMDTIDQHVTEWYADLTGSDKDSSHTGVIRLSLFRADLAKQWSRYFLRSGNIPGPFKEQMRERTLKAFPESRDKDAMQPELLDLGKIGKWAEDTWRLFGKWPVLGAFLAGSVYLALVAFIIYFASL
ncbi:MAG: hypothetical protein GVY10_07130 [Verrucomicrobia bacterium]|jgi:hypothetical protein|nr:hypothetical protein [Verrucomicrobiota bacterium]